MLYLIYFCRHRSWKCDDGPDHLRAGDGLPGSAADHEAPGQQVPPPPVHIQQWDGGGLCEPRISGGGKQKKDQLNWLADKILDENENVKWRFLPRKSYFVSVISHSKCFMNIYKIKINFKELSSNTLNIDKVKPRQKTKGEKSWKSWSDQFL